MEIRRLCHCYIVIYVIILSSVHCKTFSINEALAASERSTVTEVPPKRISTSLIDKLRSKELLGNNFLDINKLKKPLTIKELLEKRADSTKQRLAQPKLAIKTKSLHDILEERFSRNKPLFKSLKSPKKVENTVSKEKYEPKQRKAYQISIPLKPHKIIPYRPQHTRKNQSIKREVIVSHKNEQKYTSLLQSIRMLFDDLLRPGSGETTTRSKTTRNDRYKTLSYSTKDHDIICQCSAIPKKPKFGSEKEAIITSDTKTIAVTAFPIVTTATTTTTNHPPDNNINNIRPDPYIPSLSTRNTSSPRRDDNGIAEGSGTARDGGIERNITRNNRDGEYDTEQRRNETSQKYDQEDTSCGTGDGSGCIGGISRNDTRSGISGFNSETELRSIRSENVKIEQIFPERKSTNSDIAVPIEARRNETENPRIIFFQTFGNRTGGPLSTNKKPNSGKSIQSVGNNENSNYSFEQHLTGHKRVFDGSGPSPKTDQGIFTKNQEGLELKNVPDELRQINMNDDNISNGKSIQPDDNDTNSKYDFAKNQEELKLQNIPDEWRQFNKSNDNENLVNGKYFRQHHSSRKLVFDGSDSSRKTDQDFNAKNQEGLGLKNTPDELRQLNMSNDNNFVNGSIQHDDNTTNSIYDFEQHLTGHKQIFDGSDASPKTEQAVLANNQEGLELANLPAELRELDMSNANNKQVVMIIDGYSVATDKNGNHKIVKKSIKINT